MKIQFDINTNFHDYFSEAVHSWMKACNGNDPIAYKTCIILLGASVELGLLYIIKNKTTESVFKENGYTIEIRDAYKILENHSSLYEDINKRFFQPKNKDKKNQEEKTCISIIRDLRNKLLHSEGEFDTDELNDDIAHTVLVLHYLILPVEKLISNSGNKKWLIEKIQEAKHWDNISTAISEAVKNLVDYGDKHAYRESALYFMPQKCKYCDSDETILFRYDHMYYQGICFICLEPFQVRKCPSCGTEILEEDIEELDENDPTNIMCSSCYEHNFKT